MVGEIRDQETAAIAVNAALTGHLVLSTLHTSDAATTFPRLIDMGVDPFLIPSTLVLAVAQRLTRRLCEDSRRQVKPTGRVKEMIDSELAAIPGRPGAEKADQIYEGEPSAGCPKGTRGRIGIFEVFEMTPDLERVILETPSESKILAEAQRQGMITMKQDGILKVVEGVIGVKELLEVV
jgi:type IV pilus assembly protein PilB